MKPIESWQLRSIYGMGASLGIVDRRNGDHPDNLHELINALIGKQHISELTSEEANTVMDELRKRIGTLPGKAAKAKNPTKKKPLQRPEGGMTEGQCKKVWQLMYLLQKEDAEPSAATLGSRLCGIIWKQLHLSAAEADPFRWMTYRQGTQLIEILKKYVASAQNKNRSV